MSRTTNTEIKWAPGSALNLADANMLMIFQVAPNYAHASQGVSKVRWHLKTPQQVWVTYIALFIASLLHLKLQSSVFVA